MLSLLQKYNSIFRNECEKSPFLLWVRKRFIFAYVAYVTGALNCSSNHYLGQSKWKSMKITAECVNETAYTGRGREGGGVLQLTPWSCAYTIIIELHSQVSSFNSIIFQLMFWRFVNFLSHDFKINWKIILPAPKTEKKLFLEHFLKHQL